MNNEELYDSPQLEALFADFDPIEAGRIEMKMQLAAKIGDAIKAKGWSKQEFAAEMKKKPSAISKWLSGTHNFESDTLYEIGKKLGISLLDVGAKNPQPQQSINYHISISTKADISGLSPFNPGISSIILRKSKCKPLHQEQYSMTSFNNQLTQIPNA